MIGHERNGVASVRSWQYTAIGHGHYQAKLLTIMHSASRREPIRHSLLPLPPHPDYGIPTYIRSLCSLKANELLAEVDCSERRAFSFKYVVCRRLQPPRRPVQRLLL